MAPRGHGHKRLWGTALEFQPELNAEEGAWEDTLFTFYKAACSILL